VSRRPVPKKLGMGNQDRVEWHSENMALGCLGVGVAKGNGVPQKEFLICKKGKKKERKNTGERTWKGRRNY